MAKSVPTVSRENPVPIRPASVRRDAGGVPWAPEFGDRYHSADSGPGQARHVFLSGNGLPGRWAHRRAFTVLETGFGLGLNFMTTWQAWRDDPARCERLHFVSIEKHPLARQDLAWVHAFGDGLAPFAAQLQAAWPPLVAGVHRLEFEGGRVTLSLALGDAAALLARLRMHADALYLDGFAPDRNPDMWSDAVIKALARRSRPGTTASTWCTATAVRQRLERAGYVLEKRPGFGRKREMLVGRYAPRWPLRGRGWGAAPAPAERHAIVIGAGLAGAAVCERLSARGWRLDLIDRERPAAPGSGFPGLFHPHLSIDDCILSRVIRAGYLYGLARWQALERAGHALEWSRCGVLQLEDDAAPRRGAYPAAYAERVNRARAAALCGARAASGGWWFAGSGWMRPASLIAAQLAAAAGYAREAALACHYGEGVEKIAREGGSWHALTADGRVIAAAPVLILANSHGTTRLADLAQPLARVRGQVTYLPASSLSAPRSAVLGAGHVLPAIDGTVVVGSTYDRDPDPRPRADGHRANLLRASRMLPGARVEVDAAALEGAVRFRAVAPDRLPLVGAVPDVEAVRAGRDALAGAHLPDLPRHEGLYCITGFASRGLVWSSLAGELMASMLEGEPLPLESDLADALDPARFVLRRLRGGML